jgi:hypothetical protein
MEAHECLVDTLANADPGRKNIMWE